MYEESTRVPLMMSFPGKIQRNTVVDTPVSHIDVYATILDYLGLEKYDNSDGKSLRPLIENKAFNEFFDEETVVVETDYRYPLSNARLSETLANLPNFAIRHKDYKLVISKKSTSKNIDCLFNLRTDPYEKRNLLRTGKATSLGKAEHLRQLLLDWMKMNNGNEKLFSDPKYNANEGRGDMSEIRVRKLGKLVPFWRSDTVLKMGPPIRRKGTYLRNDYVFVGRTLPGQVRLLSIRVKGNENADQLLKLAMPSKKFLRKGQSLRIKVQFASPRPVDISSLGARIIIKTQEKGKGIKTYRIAIKG